MKKSDVMLEREINLNRAKSLVEELKKDIGFIENAITNHKVYPYWMKDVEDRVAALRSLGVIDATLCSIQNKRYFKKKKKKGL